ncbi:S-adenosylmethionine transporter, partial [Coemansia sp. RSA 2703]
HTKSALSHLPQAHQPLAHMAAASLGEVAACLVRVPTEVLKQRLQAQQHRGLPAAIRATYMGEGLGGFYRGYFAQVAREIPFTCIQFPLYEWLKMRRALSARRQIKPWEAALCGSLAGAVAAAATTPLDVVKTRVMLAHAGGPREGVWRMLANIAREEGARALFRGVAPRTAWISVGGFVFLGAYEQATSAMRTHGVFSRV